MWQEGNSLIWSVRNNSVVVAVVVVIVGRKVLQLHSYVADKWHPVYGSDFSFLSILHFSNRERDQLRKAQELELEQCIEIDKKVNAKI